MRRKVGSTLSSRAVHLCWLQELTMLPCRYSAMVSYYILLHFAHQAGYRVLSSLHRSLAGCATGVPRVTSGSLPSLNKRSFVRDIMLRLKPTTISLTAMELEEYELHRQYVRRSKPRAHRSISIHRISCLHGNPRRYCASA
jgi:hypothetical protein